MMRILNIQHAAWIVHFLLKLCALGHLCWLHYFIPPTGGGFCMGWEGGSASVDITVPIRLHKLHRYNAKGLSSILQLSVTQVLLWIIIHFITAVLKVLHNKALLLSLQILTLHIWWIPAAKMPTESRRALLCLMVCAIVRLNFYDISQQISLITPTPFFLNVVWVEEEGIKIKRQITGMMRLLSDKTGRVYQRVGTEQDSLTKEPQDGHLTWAHQPAPLSLVSDDHHSNSWNCAGDPGPSPSSISASIPNGPVCGQYSTRSKAVRILTNSKDLIKVNEANGRVPKHVRRGEKQQTQLCFPKEEWCW